MSRVLEPGQRKQQCRTVNHGASLQLTALGTNSMSRPRASNLGAAPVKYQEPASLCWATNISVLGHQLVFCEGLCPGIRVAQYDDLELSFTSDVTCDVTCDKSAGPPRLRGQRSLCLRGVSGAQQT